jgi:hypothetical protein
MSLCGELQNLETIIIIYCCIYGTQDAASGRQHIQNERVEDGLG